MNSTSPSKYLEVSLAARNAKTIGYYGAFVVLGLSGAVIGPTLGRLAENTHTQLNEISFLFPARAFGYLLGSILAGRLYDRLPGHRVMIVVLMLISVTLAFAPTISLLWLLTGVLMLSSLGSGALDVGGNALLVWVHREKVGPFMNALHFFFGVGAFLSPLIIAATISISGDIHLGYWTLALLAIPVIIWIVFQPSPKPIADVSKGEKGQSNPLLVALVAIFFFLYVGAEVGFGDWVFTYLRRLNLASEVSAAYLTSAFWGALTVGRALAIPIAARLRPRAILYIDLAGCLISVAIILCCPSSLTVAWIGAVGLGLSMASIFPTMISFAERRMTITGQTTSWFFVGASLGGMFLPWLIGQLFEPVGPRVTMFSIFFDLFLTVGVFAFVVFRSEHQFSEDTPSTE